VPNTQPTPTWEDIDGKCLEVILRAVSSFPKLLRECDDEAATKIVADLIKSRMNQPASEPDPAAALAEVIARARESVERENTAPDPSPASLD